MSCWAPQEMPALWNQIMDSEEADDGMEHFVDAPDTTGEGDAAAAAASGGPLPGSSSAEQPGQSKSGATADGPGSSDQQPLIGGYDMRKR